MPDRKVTAPLAAKIAALVLPVLILGGGYGVVREASLVDSHIRDMQGKLRQGEPDVIVLGSSLVRTNVNPKVLADTLGVPERNVVMLTVPNATAAHWYAILKNRVFGEGYEPRVVVVVGALTTMVTPEILKDQNVDRLIAQLGDDEPVISAKVLHTDNPWTYRWLYLKAQAGAVRDAWVKSWRDKVVQLGFHPRGGIQGAGNLADKANDVVFADENMLYELHRGDGTGLGLDSVEEIDVRGLSVRDDSLLLDLGALAQQGGANLLLVRTPFPPSNTDNDRVPTEVEAQSIEVMREARLSYLDLRSLHMDASMFQDMRHMSPRGARFFTEALGQGIRSLGLMTRSGVSVVAAEEDRPTLSLRADGASGTWTAADLRPDGACRWVVQGQPVPSVTLTRAAPPGEALPWTVTAGGEPLPRVFLGDSPPCEPAIALRDDELVYIGPTAPPSLSWTFDPAAPRDKAGRWLPAGGSLTFTAPEGGWTHGASAFRADVILRAAVDPDAIEVSLQDGQQVQLSPQGFAWRGGQSLVVPQDGQWALSVHNRSDDPVFVQGLSLGAPPYTLELVGTSEAFTPRTVRVVGGNPDDTHLQAHFFSDPPPLRPDARPIRGPHKLGAFTLTELQGLSDLPNPRFPRPHQCSPVQVLEDGVPLPNPHTNCTPVRQTGGGYVCHQGASVYFTASDTTAPLKNGRTYSLALDPSRLCDRIFRPGNTPLRGMLWLYPGDEVELTVDPAASRQMVDGVRRVDVELSAPAKQGDEPVAFELYAGARRILSEQLRMGAYGQLSWAADLPAPLAPGREDLRIILRHPGRRSYYRIDRISLHQTEPEPEQVAGTSLALQEQTGTGLFVDGPVLGTWPLQSAVRSGQPQLPAPESEPRRVGEHHWEFRWFQLWPVSNSVLVKNGLGPWSPLEVLEAGQPLPVTTDRKDFRTGCEACYLHVGQAVGVRPRGDGPQDVSLSLDESFPLPAEERDVYWVYPGTTAELTAAEPWSGDQVAVRVIARSFGANKSTRPFSLQVEGQTVYFEKVGETHVATLQLTGRVAGPWTVQVHSPADGPFLLLDQIDIVDEGGRRQLLAAHSERNTP